MRKGDQTGENFYKKLDDVSKQIQHWGLDVWRMHEMEGYKQAKLSPAMHNLEFGNVAYDEYAKHYPKNLDLALNRAFMDGDPHVLANHADSILAAAKRDDAEFFISLGGLLTKRKENKIFSSGMFAGPKSVPDLVNQVWMSGCLWLMVDTAALEFLNGIFGADIKLPSYRKARIRPKILVRHPALPIRKVQWPDLSVNHQNKVTGYKNRFSSPILAAGWRIVDGKLVKSEK